jgi:protein-tyrosine-phosphatase
VTGQKPKKARLLFVCTGNTCRSAMAETIFKRAVKERKLADRLQVVSAGLFANPGDEMSAGAKAALRTLGYPPRKHRAKRLTPAMAADARAMLVCMTAGHKARIPGRNVFTVAELTGGQDVGDPYGENLEVYLSAARYIEYSVDDVLLKAGELFDL